ncbi:MAG: hypothetical protein PHI13_15160, partial [Methylococcales bacterium]|nr:hypothetical protein [Methylococcales bacterium]
LTNLKEMIFSKISELVSMEIIKAAVLKLVSMLNPAGAIVQLVLGIYRVVKFFIDKWDTIKQLTNAILDSITNVALGNIAGAAGYIESTMAKGMTLVISFLASIFGLGGIVEKVKALIKKISDPVQLAIGKVVGWIVDKGKALFGKLFGGKDKKDERTNEQKQADLDKAIKEAEMLQVDPKASESNIKNGLKSIKKKYQMRSLVLILDNVEGTKETVHVEGEINPKKKSKNTTLEVDGVLKVSVISSNPPPMSNVGAIDIGPPKGWGYDPSDPIGGKGSHKVFEEKVGQALAKTTNLPVAEKGKKGVLPQSLTVRDLVREPKTGAFEKQPDFVLLDKGQVEVFEATLDAKFEIGTTGTGEKQLSHKRIQLAGTVLGLARMYPGVPIVFNIVTHKKLEGDLEKTLEIELKNLRKQVAKEKLKNPIQIIWRS